LKPFDPLVLKAKVRGYAEVYKLNQKLAAQAEMLAEKTRQLEKTCSTLSKTTADLLISEALANVINDTTIDSMLVLDSSGRIIKSNPAVETMFQYRRSEIVNKNIKGLFSDGKAHKYMDYVLESAQKKENISNTGYLEEVNALRKDGTCFPAELQIGMKIVQEKCVIACTIRDMTKIKQNEETIKFMAYHDGLTNLPNRRFFNDRLQCEVEAAKRNKHSFVLMYIDFDRFKYINDSLGHLYGDKLLQEIALRLKKCIRKTDFVARNGGDEFSIILPDTNREDAIEIAEKVIEYIQSPFYIDEYEIYMTASIGVSTYPFDGINATEIVKKADAALYRAKEKGNQYKIFHNGMDLKSYRTFILQNDLRKAIGRQELFLVYQPRAEIKTGRVTGVEALLRWNHGELGLISPAEFIPLAEESGLIFEIGEWVLRTACRQYKLWQEAGVSPGRMAVNFSARQFLKKDLINDIQRILGEASVQPNVLEIEITESVILDNEEYVINTLKQISDIGVLISIDDFGAGYSSLSYLRHYPVNTIKIDKCFIEELTDAKSIELVAAIVTLSHSLHMKVIAEGVERIEQYDVLRRYNCDEIQGYLFSPPVSADELAALLASSKNMTSVISDVQAASQIKRAEMSKKYKNEKIIDMALQRMKRNYALSAAETSVFHFIITGLSSKQISEKLLLSEYEVKKHISELYRKLNVNDRVEAIAKVYKACIEVGSQVAAR